mmetsp:Transcript_6786/g.25643  ORF Transcript_6786/g.25643 Transcript_6786/m.25643 type:complete len:297 (+) Transcript_6786:1669-2559(+)
MSSLSSSLFASSRTSCTFPAVLSATICFKPGAMYSYCVSVSLFKVALTITVCLPPSTPFPVWSQIRAMSRRKFDARRSSASSITKHLTPCVRRMPFLDSSASRPGVPITSSGFFFRKLSSCLRTFAPPMHCCVIDLPYSPNTLSTCRTICMASSCDGTTTKQRTSLDLSFAGKLSSSNTLAITGNRYAIVLPLPVCDCSATLVPASNAGIAATCGRLGSLNPVAFKAAHSLFGNPSCDHVGGASSAGLVSSSQSPAVASVRSSSCATRSSSVATLSSATATIASPDAESPCGGGGT